MHQSNDESYRCRVCGLDQGFQPWGKDGLMATFQVCNCCGTQFGYHDCTVRSAERKREDWLRNKGKWFWPKAKPENWSLEEQLKQIPKAFQ
jgi:hypothetical protein